MSEKPTIRELALGGQMGLAKTRIKERRRLCGIATENLLDATEAQWEEIKAARKELSQKYGIEIV